ncbi:hypothetical protein ISN45_Aa04g006350 [Arabidopsis thaliana x Arabidopsis arenosa]|uniref:Arabidopsis retrotransposon Orf1 C-terminal domain-containing protein n=1 Tax=Arabidopsis thaliana x Arabidopsis arenosa TaxID=1240361 RepID=A0A8T2A4H0_9BRAS|nr:hypothetical protein ISN45_Aa04g006350 [Arabidopsis thaliana x Arabidopsis arenosa]
MTVDELESEGLGFITFTVYGQNYMLTIQRLEGLFGFPSGTGTKQRFDRSELKDLWLTIGSTAALNSSRSKSNQICSPVIRYFQRSVAHVLYSREATWMVTNTDMEMISMALKGTLQRTKNNRTLQGDTNDTPLVILLLLHLCGYKKWAVTNNNKRARDSLCIGGVVTPILIACGVPIVSKGHEAKAMDIEHLHHIEFLQYAMVGDKYRYRFEHPTNKKANILLPCPELTRIIEGDNIDFEPSVDDLYVEMAQPMHEDIPAEEKAADVEIDEMEEDWEEPYDTSMYHFSEHVAPARESKSLSAHRNQSLLQKWCKKQDKFITKCLRGMKSLKAMVSCSSSSTAVPHGQPPQDMPSQRYDEPEPSQYRPEPSEHEVSHIPARHSSHEPQDHKRRKKAMLARSSSKSRLLNARRSLDRGASRSRRREVIWSCWRADWEKQIDQHHHSTYSVEHSQHPPTKPLDHIFSSPSGARGRASPGNTLQSHSTTSSHHQVEHTVEHHHEILFRTTRSHSPTLCSTTCSITSLQQASIRMLDHMLNSPLEYFRQPSSQSTRSPTPSDYSTSSSDHHSSIIQSHYSTSHSSTWSSILHHSTRPSARLHTRLHALEASQIRTQPDIEHKEEKRMKHYIMTGARIHKDANFTRLFILDHKGEDEPMDEEEYEMKRYHFEEHFGVARQSNSSAGAHKHIGLLQAWNKAQDKVLEKLNGIVRTFKKMLSCSSTSTAIPMDIAS